MKPSFMLRDSGGAPRESAPGLQSVNVSVENCECRWKDAASRWTLQSDVPDRNLQDTLSVKTAASSHDTFIKDF